MTRTTALYAVPSFLSGVASILDIGSTLTIYNDSKNSDEADRKALYSDWAAVGDDLEFAMSQYQKDNGK